MTNITDEQLSNAAALVKSITGKDYFAAFNTHQDRVLEIFARAYELESERSRTILKQSITISKLLNENAILKQEKAEVYNVEDKLMIAELNKALVIAVKEADGWCDEARGMPCDNIPEYVRELVTKASPVIEEEVKK